MKSKLKIPRKLNLKKRKFPLDKISVKIPLSRNSPVLYSFALYCQQNPNERFWQALRSWSGQGYIYASNKMSPDRLGHFKDTFYWEGRTA